MIPGLTGIDSVLNERFIQDILEEYYGGHCYLGRRNDNPTVHQFGYQTNTLRMARSVNKITGNTSGRHKGKHVSWFDTTDEPLKKRQATSTTTITSPKVDIDFEIGQ